MSLEWNCGGTRSWKNGREARDPRAGSIVGRTGPWGAVAAASMEVRWPVWVAAMAPMREAGPGEGRSGRASGMAGALEPEHPRGRIIRGHAQPPVGPPQQVPGHLPTGRRFDPRRDWTRRTQ